MDSLPVTTIVSFILGIIAALIAVFGKSFLHMIIKSIIMHENENTSNSEQDSTTEQIITQSQADYPNNYAKKEVIIQNIVAKKAAIIQKVTLFLAIGAFAFAIYTYIYPPTPPVQPLKHYILRADDGAAYDVYSDIAYIVNNNIENDGSISVKERDNSYKIPKPKSNSSMKFTYKANGTEHEAGIKLLFAHGQRESDPGAIGPNLRHFSRFTFRVRGHGGTVKFYIVGVDDNDIDRKSTKIVKLTDNWKKYTLFIDDRWRYCNIPFAWECNESSPDRSDGTIEFWCAGMRFE